MTAAPLLRPCVEADLAAVTDIYRHAVLHGTGTFELEAPSLEEMRRRLTDVRGKGFPWLVVQTGGTVVGYAYANTFRPRPAFNGTVEDSVYLAPDAQGLGFGRALLAELIRHCERGGLRQMVAVIGDSANARSIGLHEACGFMRQGVLPGVGWKFDRWLDVVLMQRSLGVGAQRPAQDRDRSA